MHQSRETRPIPLTLPQPFPDRRGGIRRHGRDPAFLFLFYLRLRSRHLRVPLSSLTPRFVDKHVAHPCVRGRKRFSGDASGSKSYLSVDEPDLICLEHFPHDAHGRCWIPRKFHARSSPARSIGQGSVYFGVKARHCPNQKGFLVGSCGVHISVERTPSAYPIVLHASRNDDGCPVGGVSDSTES